jgi:hypothetical protein
MNKSVTSIVWPWREKAVEPEKAGRQRPKASSVLIQVAVTATIGAALYFWLKYTVMALVVWSVAGVVLVSGFFVPPVFRAIERLGQWLGWLVGTILTWGLLAPFYYLVFLPMHLAQRVRGKDPLARSLHTGAPTYWSPRAPVPDPAQYKKQF